MTLISQFFIYSSDLVLICDDTMYLHEVKPLFRFDLFETRIEMYVRIDDLFDGAPLR